MVLTLIVIISFSIQNEHFCCGKTCSLRDMIMQFGRQLVDLGPEGGLVAMGLLPQPSEQQRKQKQQTPAIVIGTSHTPNNTQLVCPVGSTLDGITVCSSYVDGKTIASVGVSCESANNCDGIPLMAKISLPHASPDACNTHYFSATAPMPSPSPALTVDTLPNTLPVGNPNFVNVYYDFNAIQGIGFFDIKDSKILNPL
jgi:hypothetical protein